MTPTQRWGRSLNDEVFAETALKYPEECQLAEDAIHASFSAFGALSRSSGTGGGLDSRKQDLLAFFYRNCVYLLSSYQLARRGLLDPAGNNLRTVFETVVWQYAYLTDDEVYANFAGMSAMDGEKLRLIKSGAWSNTKERALENMRRKYSFQKMMKRLYSKERYERFFYSQYWALCQKSHSSVYGINHNTPNMHGGKTFDSPGDSEEARGMLYAILYLCAENLTCFLNCFHGRMNQGEIDSALGQINRINRRIPPALGLAPDTRKMEFSERFREPGTGEGGTGKAGSG